MNKLKKLYQDMSSSIWNRIPFSYNMGFKYSEVTITENLLFDIYKFNINNPNLAINIFEAKNEKANGNDFELCLEIEANKYVIFVIQAKKLYVATQKYSSISHKVNYKKINEKFQIDLLEDYAKQEKAISLYMLYNYSPDFKKKNKKYYGCTLIFSKFIKENYYLKTSAVSWKIPTFNDLHKEYHAVPLHTLALNGLQIKRIIDKTGINYKMYSKNELTDNKRWIEIFDKNNQDFTNYKSDEFEPKYRIIIGRN